MIESELAILRKRIELLPPGPWQLFYGKKIYDSNQRHICSIESSLMTSYGEDANIRHFLGDLHSIISNLLAAIDDRDKVIHDMMEESDARRSAMRYREALEFIRKIYDGPGSSNAIETIVKGMLSRALETNS